MLDVDWYVISILWIHLRTASTRVNARQRALTRVVWVPLYALRLLGNTRSSAEKPRDAPQIRNVVFEKACNTGMTFKDTQGHYLLLDRQYTSITSC